MRVLHVIPSVAMTEGGPSAAIRLIERGLTSAGLSVTTLTTDHGMGAEIPANGQDLASARGAVAPDRVYMPIRLNFYKVAPGMLGWLDRNLRSFDVVHVHALFSFAPVAAALAARRSGTPYIVRPLGTLSIYGMSERRRALKAMSVRLIEGRVLKDAAAVHFTSEVEREEAAGQGLKFRASVIPIGIEPGMVRPERDQGAATPQDHARPNVLYLSRIDPKKNLEALIDAFSISTYLRSSARLTIAGSGDPDYVARLSARIADAGLTSLVTWLGHVEGGKKAAAFVGADVYALPSFSENFGIAAAEAMMAGLPVVLAPGVAIAEEASSAGACLVAGPDPAPLAATLEELLRNEERRRRLSDGARAFARREYSVETMTRRLIGLYEDILRQNRPI